MASILVAAVLAVALGGAVSSASPGDAPFLVEQQFSSFPPADWSASSGTWVKTCPALPDPMVLVPGCSAVGAMPGAGQPGAQLSFNPSGGIPSNVEDLTLSFYSDFTPDPATSGDVLGVYQSSNGTLDPEHLSALDTSLAGGAHGSQVLVTVPLSSTKLPLVFKWTTSSPAPDPSSGTWAISYVKLTGTIPSIAYSLTADPIDNLQYNVTAGTPVELTLSGASVPAGDSLTFSITTPPALGSLGPVAFVDATHSHVTYTAPVDACPDPLGLPSVICTTSFQYKASDLSGNESAPANVALDVHPGGAGAQTVTVDAPSSVPYESLTKPGDASPSQGADLSDVLIGPLGFPDRVEVDLGVSGGALYLPLLGGSGVTLLNGTASGTPNVQFYGSITQVRNAMTAMSFFPTTGTPEATLSVETYDRGATGTLTHQKPGATAMVAITAAPPPAPKPVVTIPLPGVPHAVTGPDGSPFTFSGPGAGITIVDDGATPATQDTIVLSVDKGELALPATSGITQDQVTDGILNLTGTVADLNAALTNLTYDANDVPINVNSATFSAFVTDPDVDTRSVTQSVDISILHSPITLEQVPYTVRAGTPSTIWLCGVGPAGSIVTLDLTAPPGHGTFTANPDAAPSDGAAHCGSFAGTVATAYTYTATAGYAGPESVKYMATDSVSHLSSEEATIPITVVAHLTPTADDKTVSTRQGEPVTFEICGNDPESTQSPPFLITEFPTRGTLASAPDQTTLNTCAGADHGHHVYVYTPAPDDFTSSGTDTFKFIVSNGVDSDPATVTINVATHTPKAEDEAVSVDENSRIGVGLCSTAPDGGPLTLSIVTPPVHGTLDDSGSPNNPQPCDAGTPFNAGSKSYIPGRSFRGTDSFTYTVSSHGFTSAPATVSITVNEIEIPPTIAPQTVNVIVPHPKDVTLAGVSENDKTPLTYRVVTQPAHGTVTGGGSSSVVTYTPTGPTTDNTDSFQVAASDGVAEGAPTTISVVLVKPGLTPSLCTTSVPPLGCTDSLTSVPDGSGGQIPLAHSNGSAPLGLQVSFQNTSAGTDPVTLKAPATAGGWNLIYTINGIDVTSAIAGAGSVVTLGPFATVDVQVRATLGTGSSLPPGRFTITATSGNEPTVSASQAVEIENGSSLPALSVSRSDNTATVTSAPPATPFASFTVPPLAAGRPAVNLIVQPALSGAGSNRLLLKATPTVAGMASIKYMLGATDVTAAVLAGTETIDCGIENGCPTFSVNITPTGPGSYGTDITLTSTIDGRFAEVGVQGVVATPQPDLRLNSFEASIGQNVFEAVPVTEVASIPVEASGSVSNGTRLGNLFLRNTASVAETETIRVVTDTSQDPTGAFTISGLPTGSVNQGGGVYTVPLGATEEIIVPFSYTAGPTAGVGPSVVVLTATSGLDPTKVDSFKLSFPSYAYFVASSPVTAAQHTVDAPVSQDFTLTENNVGRSPDGVDNVVIKAPASNADFTLTYALRQSDGGGTDVTADVTSADGLHTALFTSAPGGDTPPTKILTVTAKPTASAKVKATLAVPVKVTSLSALPAGQSVTSTWNLINWGPPPTVSISSPVDGASFHKNDKVAASFTCVAGALQFCQAFVSKQGGSAVPLSTPHNGDPLPTSVPGHFTLSAVVQDEFGRSADVTSKYTVIDPPTVNITGPADKAEFDSNKDTPHAAFTCASESSTITSCAASLTRPDGNVDDTVTNGSEISIKQSGTYRLTVTATDATLPTHLTFTRSYTFTVTGGDTVTCVGNTDDQTAVDLGAISARTTDGGCFVNKDGTLQTSSPLKINGMSVPASPAHTLTTFSTGTVDGKAKVYIGLTSQPVLLGDYEVIGSQKVAWAMDASATDVTAVTVKGGATFKGLSVSGGVTIHFRKGADKVPYTTFVLNIALPNVFTMTKSGGGGVAGDASIKMDQDGNYSLDGLKLTANGLYMGSVSVDSVCFSFVPGGSSGAVATCPQPDSGGAPFVECGSTPDVDRWDGNAIITLPNSLPSDAVPPKLPPKFAFYGAVAGGSVASLGGSVSQLGQRVPVGTDVYLDHASIGVCIQPPPFRIKGDVGVTILPPPPTGDQTKKDIVDVDGTFEYTDPYQGQPWRLVLAGTAKVLGTQIGSAGFTLLQTGWIGFSAQLGVNFANIVSLDGGVYGWLDTPHRTFNVTGYVQGCVLEICASLSAVASSSGAAGCLSLGSLDIGGHPERDADWDILHFWRIHWVDGPISFGVGAGVRWDNTSHPSVLGGSCDLSPYSATQTQSRALRAAGDLGFTVAPGTPAISVKVLGNGGVPDVVFHSPDGQTISSPSAPLRSAISPGHWMLAENATDNSTSIVLMNPASGNWTVTPGPGLITPASLQTAGYNAPPAVSGTVVSGHDSKKTVKMAYAIPAGSTMSLVEYSGSVQRTLRKTVVADKACPGPDRPGGEDLQCASVTFTPTPGPGGKRVIYALVTNADGLPLKQIRVATYKAPAQRKPTRPTKLRIRRVGSGVVVSWHAAKRAVHQNLSVFLGSGGRFSVTTTRCTVVRLKHVASAASVKVRIAGERGTDSAYGPSLTKLLPGGKSKTANVSAKVPKACIVHGPTAAG